jgi:pyruvate dehydrogenase (quinone)
VDFYPKPGQAQGCRVDLKPERIGLRYPVEAGLVGDVKATLQALVPMLGQKQDRGFLTTAQARISEWNAHDSPHFLPPRSCADSDRFPTRPGVFRG